MEIVLGIIGVILIVAFGWLLSINGNYHVKRSIAVDTSKEKAYQLISDFNSWRSWSPWLCMEAEADVKISNNGKGVGAINSWVGSLVGSGEIEHIALKENEHINQQIRFIKPFKSKSDVYWQFKELESGCEITWGMKGAMPFFLKFMAKQMEPWIGMDYERGLKMIKDQIEKGKIDSEITINGVDELESFNYVAINKTCLMADVGSSMKEAFGQINTLCESESIEHDWAFSIYHQFDFTKPDCNYSSGVPLKHEVECGDEFKRGIYPGIKAVKVSFKGDYEHLGNAWAAAYSYLRYKKLKANKKIDPIELYLNDPTKETDPANWLTAIYIPIK
ncbi:GyrI-like domain-containing protein [Carboxylicivirga sp. M1479]|uniref:SRPBCC family protein n=1 Tax=Carboxylicivirga sp. M1479 TaxID=2594476 RepID=UPI0011775F9E|nr:GyrI-like domain-containing protein [Carboxylicivirga sp. M1479]TRX66472.1 hypothetical protein FNN09_13245 [Carboxylicivirga sp. M1479]